jgi:hypothetical protein
MDTDETQITNTHENLCEFVAEILASLAPWRLKNGAMASRRLEPGPPGGQFTH